MATIQFDTPAGAIDGLLGIPEGKGPFPAVVVIHDAIGYRADVEAISAHIAEAGYLALTPNLYARGGRGAASDESCGSC